MKRTRLVRYNPGDAGGSPIYVTRGVAKKMKAQDESVLLSLESSGQRFKKWPKIEVRS